MVDVVVNHMAYYCGAAQTGHCGPQGSINYSSYPQFNSESYFHPFCEIDYNNATSILDVSPRQVSTDFSVGKGTKRYRFAISGRKTRPCRTASHLTDEI